MFSDSRHTVGLDVYSKAALTSIMKNQSETSCRHIRRSKPQYAVCSEAAAFGVYIHHPAASGCVTKTLTGRFCNEAVGLTSADRDLALERLRSFYFVGIFEKWAELVHIFHARRDVVQEPCPVELTHTRQRPREAAPVTDALTRVAEEAGYRDPYDGVLYSTALSIFSSYLPPKSPRIT